MADGPADAAAGDGAGAGAEQVPLAPAPRAPRREPPLVRLLTTAWCLAAGALLSVAPHAPRAWNDAMFADHPQLQALLLADAVRWSISVFGLVVLACGAWDVSRFVVEDVA